MGKVRLKNIFIRGFRSIVEPTTIQFPEVGMVCIRGVNHDSRGSSGSGKSTVNLAITYALGICPFPATTLQSWLTEEPMQVVLTLVTDQGEVVIDRGSKVNLTIAGQKLGGSAKAVEEKLREILGLAPDLLAALTYRQQQERGLFLGKTDSEKKEFLTTLLDLGRFEKVGDETQDRVRGLEVTASADTAEVLKWEQELAKIPVAEETFEDENAFKAEVAAAESHIAQTQAAIKGQEVVLAQALARINADTAAIGNGYLPRLSEFKEQLEELPTEPYLDRLQQDLLQAKLIEVSAEVQSLRAAEADLRGKRTREMRDLLTKVTEIKSELRRVPEWKAKGEAILAQLTVLENNKCPTCDQTWLKNQDRKRSLELELVKLTEFLEDLENRRQGLAPLEEQLGLASQPVLMPGLNEAIQAMDDAKEAFSAETQRLNQIAASFEADLKRKRAEIQERMSLVKAQALEAAAIHKSNAETMLDDFREKLDALGNELRVAQSHLQGCSGKAYQAMLKNREAKNRLEMNKRQRDDVTRYLGQATTKSVASSATLAEEKDFLALIGREGFLGSIFDEVLFDISQETNKVLASIPNTAHVTLHFRSESTTQKGTIKRAIVPVVSIGGHEAPLKSGCSGGMITAVELAVDLAVARVVSRRTGAVPSWVILDEAFEGLGVVEKEGCLEILNVFAQDKLILVVDHASEFKEMFQQFINVDYESGISRIT